jgi:hypothetical protein
MFGLSLCDFAGAGGVNPYIFDQGLMLRERFAKPHPRTRSFGVVEVRSGVPLTTMLLFGAVRFHSTLPERTRAPVVTFR